MLLTKKSRHGNNDSNGNNDGLSNQDRTLPASTEMEIGPTLATASINGSYWLLATLVKPVTLTTAFYTPAEDKDGSCL
jgi:hypothetical protein